MCEISAKFLPGPQAMQWGYQQLIASSAFVSTMMSYSCLLCPSRLGSSVAGILAGRREVEVADVLFVG